jgi:hypothetical protein
MGIQTIFRGNLKAKLNEIWYKGYTEFRRYDLLLWFGKDQLNNTVWREVNEEWNAFCETYTPIELQIVRREDSQQDFLVVKKTLLKDFSEVI